MRAETLSKRIGQLIKKKRIEGGFTSASLGKELKLSKAAISNIENGRQRIYIDTLWKMAEVFQCPILELLPIQQGYAPNTKSSSGDLAEKKGVWWAEKEKVAYGLLEHTARQMEALNLAAKIPHDTLNAVMKEFNRVNSALDTYRDSMKDIEEAFKRMGLR